MPTTRDRLLDLLAARPGLAQHQLAARLGIVTRTARRHLRALEDEGVVIATPDGSSCRYRLADDAHPATPVPRFTDREAEALAVAALAARPLLAPTPLLGPLETATDKLQMAALAEVLSFEPETETDHWSFDSAAGGISMGIDPDIFQTLLQAARNGHAVRAYYHTASRQSLGEGRRLAPLAPLALMVRSGSWMAPCLDLDVILTESGGGHPVKDFALAGFHAATPLPEVWADCPEGWSLETYAADRLRAFDGAPETVRLWVSPEAAPYFRRKAHSRTQQVEAEHPGPFV